MVLYNSEDRRLGVLDNLLELDSLTNKGNLPFNILIYQNYGFGDMVQYLRYIPEFRKRFTGKLCLVIKGNFYEPWVEVQVEPPSFKWLILNNYGKYIDDIIIQGWNAIPTEYNYKIEFMDLAKFINYDVSPDVWKKYDLYDRLKKYPDRINIGYCLTGSKGHPDDKYRSIDKIHFSKFINTFKDKVNFIDLSQENLQKEFSIVTIEDTLSIIQSLDLVITVDTLITHLAGYNDIPIFLLHGKINDDRWKNKNWYSNITHFYQGENDEWGRLINTDLTKNFSDWWENELDYKTRSTKSKRSSSRYITTNTA